MRIRGIRLIVGSRGGLVTLRLAVNRVDSDWSYSLRTHWGLMSATTTLARAREGALRLVVLLTEALATSAQKTESILTGW